LLLGFHFVFAQEIVGLYVNDFKTIIGDPVKETALLNYAQDNGFNYLILYNLNYIHNNIFALDDATTSLPLANFINTAKTSYGILQVAAVGEKNASFDKIKIYNSFYPADPNKRFDVFNIEFEFWNAGSVGPGDYYCTTYLVPGGYPCTIDGAFSFYIAQLTLLKTYCDANGIIAETYIGYPTATQSEQIVLQTHRVLVHYYRTSDVYGSGNSIYQYNSYRIEDLAQHPVTILPIFSSRVAHMYTWLLTHPLTQPYVTFLTGVNGFNAQVGAWKSNVTFDGYVWYRYSELAEISGVLATQDFTVENPYVFVNQYEKELLFKNFKTPAKAIVYTVNGSVVVQFKVREKVHLTAMNSGVYIVKVLQENNMVYTQKIVIN